MAKQFKAEGIISAMVTPMTQGGAAVDLDKVRAVAAFIAGEGADGLFVCGTTGEGPLMSCEERRAVLEAVINEVGDRVAVVAHTGAPTTAETIALTQHARDAGAKAAGLVTPGYFRYDDKAIAAFYGDVAKALPDFSILLYNIPQCTGNPLSVELVLGLAERYDNIVGLKDSSGDLGAMTRLLAGAPKDFAVINGSDLCMFQAFVAGAQGAVTGTSNVTMPLCAAIRDNVRQGRLDAAWEAQCRLALVVAAMEYGGKTAYYKEALALRGVDAGVVRPPQRALTAAEKRKLETGLREAGLLR